MSKNTNLSFLTDYITADITNGRIGINNASPTYAFDVTGIARTSTSAYFATASGQVGIGTTSPTHIFEINKNTTSTTAGLYPVVNLDNGNASGYTSLYFSQAGVVKAGFDYNNAAVRWDIYSVGDMRFLTASTERMRITSGGNVGIGTTSPAVRLQIDGTNNQERFRLQNTDGASYTSFTEQEIRMWRPNDSGAAFQLATQAFSGTWTGGGGGIVFSPLNTLRMTIGPTGNIGAPSGTNIYNASDARLKKNISKITYGLDAISALNPVKFNWIDGFEPSEDGKYMLGFVAQEVFEILPEAVELFGNDINLNGETIITPLRVNEKFIIPVLVKAIQELKAEIETLKQK
jgi:hypothetical protein